jgi:hypothetical protein
MTGTRLGQVPIVASWMQYETGRNRGNRRVLTRTRLAAVSASVFHRRGFGVGEGDDPAHGGSGFSQSRRWSVGLTLTRETPPRP